MKSEGVKDVFTWLKGKCKEQKKKVDSLEQGLEEMKHTYIFPDEMCLIEDAEKVLEYEKGKLDAYVGIKVSVEKYMKKLKHMEVGE